MGFECWFNRDIANYCGFKELFDIISEMYHTNMKKWNPNIEEGNSLLRYDGQAIEITPEMWETICKRLKHYDGEYKKYWKKDKKRIGKLIRKGKSVYFNASW